MDRILRIILLAALGLLAQAGGCRHPGDNLAADFQSEDPSQRVRAVVEAGQTKDSAAVPFLVDRLTDSQQEVRFFAIIALERITGQTMGYNYYDPPDERAAAVARWRQWLQNGRSEGRTQEIVSSNGPDS